MKKQITLLYLITLLLFFSFSNLFSQSLYTNRQYKPKKEVTVIKDHKGTVTAHIEKTDTGTVYMIADTLGTIQSLYMINYAHNRLLTERQIKRKSNLK